MKTAHLSLPLVEEAPTDIVAPVELLPEELALLEHFILLMDRVRDAALLQRGMPGFAGMTWDANGITFKAGKCTNPELHELLHVLRPVTLENERSNFNRVAVLLGRRIADPRVRSFLKLCKKVFRDGEMSLYMQVTLGNQPVFDESLLHLWLNGTQYHTDADKASAWAQLENSLSVPSCRALVVAQLHSKVLALLNVDYISRQVIAASHGA